MSFDYVQEWEIVKNIPSMYRNVGTDQNLLFHVDFNIGRQKYRVNAYYRSQETDVYFTASDLMHEALFTFQPDNTNTYYTDDNGVKEIMRRANSLIKLKAFW